MQYYSTLILPIYNTKFTKEIHQCLNLKYYLANTHVRLILIPLIPFFLGIRVCLSQLPLFPQFPYICVVLNAIRPLIFFRRIWSMGNYYLRVLAYGGNINCGGDCPPSSITKVVFPWCHKNPWSDWPSKPKARTHPVTIQGSYIPPLLGHTERLRAVWQPKRGTLDGIIIDSRVYIPLTFG